MIQRPSASFTRPGDITAYADTDLVANSTTAGSVTPLVFSVPESCVIERVKLHKSGTSVTSAQFRLHLWTAAPTAANGDNGTFSTTGVATYLGAFAVTIDRAFSDGAAGTGVALTAAGSKFLVSAPNQTLYGLLEAKAAYTPANAEVFTATLELTSA